MRRTCSHRPPAFQPSAFSIAVRESESSADLYLVRLRQVWGGIANGRPTDGISIAERMQCRLATQAGVHLHVVAGAALASFRWCMFI
jgi:hypothetical protein